MAIYISSEFNINPNIAKKPSTVLDSSWVYGSMVYADSVDELPTHPKLVRQGNLGSVKDPLNPNNSVLYQANLNNAGKIVWSKLKTGATGNGGNQEIYFTPEQLEHLSESEMEDLPDDFLVVSEENFFEENELLNSLIKKINDLQKEVVRIKNTFNDFSAVNIEETTSNYGSYISFHQDTQPITEVDWKDSSNGQIVYNGTSSKFGTDKGTNINWIDPDSSNGWKDNWKGREIEIYSSSVVNNNVYPYYELAEDGQNPDTNILSDGADEKLTLRHFAPKYARTYSIMNRYRTSLIPYELVLCLENNGLYYYNLNKNKMVLLAGGGTVIPDDDDGDDPIIPPSTNIDVKYEIDKDGYLNIITDDENVFVDGNGILNISASVENGILIFNDSEKMETPNVSIDSENVLNILENNSAFIDSEGYLNITSPITNGILNI